jgi:LemA protein
MSITLIIFLAILLTPIFWGVSIYNHLITLKNNSIKAWSNIDVLLKQRNSELPKLIDTCKQHMKHEKDTLERVIKARNLVESAMKAQNLSQLGSAEMKLESSLNGLFAVSENYPELRSSDAFLRLQSRITTLEESISDRREFYNDTAALSNTRLQQFPDNIIANSFSFKEHELLEFRTEELKDVDVSASFV